MLSELRFIELCKRLSPVLDARAIFAELQRAYSEPAREYHNAAHIADCLARFDEVRAEFIRPDESEFALWFHDVVYDTHAKDNEEQSAQLAVKALQDGGSAKDMCARVERLILATKHAETPSDNDAQLIADIDLSILGRGAAEFGAYDAAIRREYAWVPDVEYREGRAELLRGFLKRERIYAMPHFFELYEQQTRKNLERAIESLMRTG